MTKKINKNTTILLHLTRSESPPFNPLSPKSDQHQISPCIINALLNRVVMRIRDMIAQDEFYQLLLTNSVGNE